jgi:chemotaxis protein methyltransferase CheR
VGPSAARTLLAGFRRVRRQVCRRIGSRVQGLKLPDLRAYRAYLEAHPEEWRVLDTFCRIPISRFLRDRTVFERLAARVLPDLAAAAMARGARSLSCWSAGCASGEEPYSLMILWKRELASRIPGLSLSIVATDIEEHLLERARAARYRRSGLRELPRAWIDAAFAGSGDLLELRPEFREGIAFRREDIREKIPWGPFDLILCRNLVFTYFDASRQPETLARILGELRPGGALVIGLRERLPEGAAGVADWDRALGIYRRTADPESATARASGEPEEAPAKKPARQGADRWS